MSTTAPARTYECGLCGKGFARGDLRDRHKRRCQEKLDKPKRPKRRSCLACVTSRLRCDLQRPVCSRCSQRHLSCHYAELDTSAFYYESTTNISEPLATDFAGTAWSDLDSLTTTFGPALQQSTTTTTLDDISIGPSVFGGFEDDQWLMQTLSEYPQMMLRKEAPPPFVHLFFPYVCSQSEVPEPLARALCCINAANAASTHSRSFAKDLINDERTRLISQFRIHNCLKETLAAIHAMIVYQILDLFGQDTDRLRIAQLCHHFLIRMTSEFARHHQELLIPPGEDEEVFGSPQWILGETVRRTVFVVHAINVLSARMHRQHPFFYEPLDNDLILDMPLPVAEDVWRGHTRASWAPSPAHQPKRLSANDMHQLGTVAAALGEHDSFSRLILATCSPAYMNFGSDGSP